MRKSKAVLSLLACLALALPALVARAGDAQNDVRVVLISIDGLRPEFYTSDEFETPTLKALAASGAQAAGVEAVYPSLTYPGHASIVTGVRPVKHGIVANTRFDEHGARPEWFWETKDVRAKTLWQAAREKGRKVAITEWPSSIGADVDWLIPERWAIGKESTRDLLLQHSTKGLLAEVALALGAVELGPDVLADFAKLDEFISKTASYVLSKKKPDLLLVHLAQVDHEEHQNGRDGKAVREAVRRQDGNVARIRKACEEAGLLEKTVFVVTGDHGFTDVVRTVSPNVLLAKAGLIDAKDGKVESWKAIGHAFGGSMAVFARDRASSRAAREALEKAREQSGKRLYSILDRPRLDELGANPEAAFWLEAEEGVGLAGTVAGDLVSEEREKRGTHGGLPTRRELRTGFIANGPGVRKARLEKIRLIDVAPVIAKLMDLDLPDAEGGVPDMLTVEPD